MNARQKTRECHHRGYLQEILIRQEAYNKQWSTGIKTAVGASLVEGSHESPLITRLR